MHRFTFTANTRLLKGESLLISNLHQENGQTEAVAFWEDPGFLIGHNSSSVGATSSSADGGIMSETQAGKVLDGSLAVWSNSTLRVVFARDVGRYERFSLTVRLRNPSVRRVYEGVEVRTSATLVQPVAVLGQQVLTGNTPLQFVVGYMCVMFGCTDAVSRVFCRLSHLALFMCKENVRCMYTCSKTLSYMHTYIQPCSCMKIFTHAYNTMHAGSRRG
jgi:hypothetical protein